jgi:thioredoxin-like negative regulator of GroEL
MMEPLNVDADDWHVQVHESSMPVLVDFWHDAWHMVQALGPCLQSVSGRVFG